MPRKIGKRASCAAHLRAFCTRSSKEGTDARHSGHLELDEFPPQRDDISSCGWRQPTLLRFVTIPDATREIRTHV